MRHDLEHPLQALHLLLGLPHVNGKCALELLGLSGFGQFGQAFQDGILGEVGVLELVQEEGFQIFIGHGSGSWVGFEQ